MSEAEYFSTGEVLTDGGGLGHYGLALDLYTHFTSPIRRYADILAHRQLLRALALDQSDGGAPGAVGTWSYAEVAAMAASLNERNRASKRAQKECADLYLQVLLQASPRVAQVGGGRTRNTPMACWSQET